jgi:U3 small nucleolar RNA-associated protein 25
MMADARSGAAYASLLQALRPRGNDVRAPKRRKVSHSTSRDELANEQSHHAYSNGDESSTLAEESVNSDLVEAVEDVDDGDEAPEQDDSESEDDATSADPFEQHFAGRTSDQIDAVTKLSTENTQKPVTKTIAGDVRRTWTPFGDASDVSWSLNSAEVYMKQRLKSRAAVLSAQLGPLERDQAAAIFSYKDLVAGNRTAKNIAHLRDACVLHSLNHVFKTRDRVLRNNSKLVQSDGGDLELRDQGFTRPKILVVVPTKQSCVRVVDSIVAFSEPEQQENKARFLETFSREDEDEWLEKPEDFRELFGGNHEEDFRIGLKFTRKTIKYFSGFYNSDIIICSPLGLFRTINSGGSKDGKKGPDADFLSSIEVMLMDHASSLQMQNWPHVDFIFDHLNALPKESHGCDFSRVRTWYLDGKAKHLRQTIILSSFLTPEINRLVSKHLHNIAGRVKYLPSYDGVMIEVPSLLPIPISQTFVRIEPPTPAKDSDVRFKYFCASILPQIIRDKSSKGVLLFVPAYADFTRLRNHLTNSAEGSSVSFGGISEYTSVKETTRARSHFLSGRHNLLMYTERAHHFFRYRLKGVQKVIFYGLPENPIFWTELVALLGLNRDLVEGKVAGGKGSIRALFSKWDALKLERVAGTGRVGRLLSESNGDTFDFV